MNDTERKVVNNLMGDLVDALLDEVKFCQDNGLEVSENSLAVLKRCKSAMGEELTYRLEVIETTETLNLIKSVRGAV